jgi:nitrite reductase (NADH) small subunit
MAGVLHPRLAAQHGSVRSGFLEATLHGVCALINNQQVAVFRVGEAVHAIANYDPFSQAYVLSRGIVGDRRGIPKVASPIYKHFSFLAGECFDDDTVRVEAFLVPVVEGQVEVGVVAAEA